MSRTYAARVGTAMLLFGAVLCAPGQAHAEDVCVGTLEGIKVTKRKTHGANPQAGAKLGWIIEVENARPAPIRLTIVDDETSALDDVDRVGTPTASTGSVTLDTTHMTWLLSAPAGSRQTLEYSGQLHPRGTGDGQLLNKIEVIAEGLPGKASCEVLEILAPTVKSSAVEGPDTGDGSMVAAEDDGASPAGILTVVSLLLTTMLGLVLVYRRRLTR